VDIFASHLTPLNEITTTAAADYQFNAPSCRLLFQLQYFTTISFIFDEAFLSLISPTSYHKFVTPS
jgi:hypothetical protein